MGDALGIGNGIIRRAGGVGNAVQVAAADAVAALGVGATVRDAAVADRAADRLFADAFLVGGFVLYGTESDEQRDQQEFTGIPAGILAGFLARIPAGITAERSTK